MPELCFTANSTVFLDDWTRAQDCLTVLPWRFMQDAAYSARRRAGSCSQLSVTGWQHSDGCSVAPG